MIKNRQNDPGPGVKYSEVYIQDDNNIGTGNYVTVLEPNALGSKDPIVSMVINIPIFQLSVNINPSTKEIPVLLGRSDGSLPISTTIFVLPQNITLSDSYKFETTFVNWKIKELLLNGIRLQRKVKEGTVAFWFDPKKNPGAFKEGIKYCWGIFEINGEECTIISDGIMLSAILNINSNDQRMIFNIVLNPDPNKNHMIAVTWNSEELNLYFDGENIQCTNFDKLNI